jgi:hypothetical protein
VGIRSEDALIETRNEGGKGFALAHRPGRGTAHYLLRQLGEWASKERLPVEQRADNAWGVAHDDPQETKHGFFTETMSPVNFL